MARQAVSAPKKAKPALADRERANQDGATPDRATHVRNGVPAASRSRPRLKQDRLKLDGLSLDQQVTVLLREREKLIGAVEALDQRLQVLEAREAHLADRISWALDALKDLLHEQE